MDHRAPGPVVWELRLVVYLVKKMAGQLGNKITTIKLKVIQINLEENFSNKGSVPGNLETY
jgi:ribosomal protein L3